MASVYKRAGAKKYTITYKDHNGKRRELLGCADKQASEKIANKLEADVMYRKRGLIDPAQEKLAENDRRSLEECVEAFRDYLDSKGGTDKHIAGTISYILAIIRECNFTTPATLDANRVTEYLARLRRSGFNTRTYNTKRGLITVKVPFGVRAYNAHITAIKSFTRWLHTTGQSRADAMITLKRDTKGERMDKRHPRRAMTDGEIAHLIHAAENGPDYMNMTGHDRAVLYRLALGTGFRALELRSLTPANFDLADKNNATATVLACYSKRGRDDHQVIRAELAELMAGYIMETRKHPNTRLFDMPEKNSEMIKADLERARTLWIKEAKTDAEREGRERSDFLRYKDSNGLAADFHALRHTFITNLARAGVSPKVAQTLARHSTITLTMDRYTHILNGDLRTALNQLPDFCQEGQELQKTGTDDQSPPGGLQRRLQHLNCPEGQNPSLPVMGETADDLPYAENQESVILSRNDPSDPVYQDLSLPATPEPSTASRRSRTYDPLIKSQLLYQLS